MRRDVWDPLIPAKTTSESTSCGIDCVVLENAARKEMQRITGGQGASSSNVCESPHENFHYGESSGLISSGTSEEALFKNYDTASTELFTLNLQQRSPFP